MRQGLENRAKLVRRRQLLHGRITATRALYLHELTRRLASGFDVVCIEDPNVAGTANRQRRIGRSVSGAGLGELVRQLDCKTETSGMTPTGWAGSTRRQRPVARAGAVRTKLPLHVRPFTCDTCDTVLARNVNTARNIKREGLRLLREQLPPGEPVRDVASMRGETRNGDPRTGETQHAPQGVGGHGPFEDATDPASLPRAGSQGIKVMVA